VLTVLADQPLPLIIIYRGLGIWQTKTKEAKVASYRWCL